MARFSGLVALVLLASQPAAVRGGQEISAASKDDFDKAVTKGSNDKLCSVTNAGGGGLHLRSGAPKQTPTARILTPIDSVAQIKEISFSYQYISGFSNGKLPSTFELWIQDEAGKDAAGPIYTSPPLGEYMYEKCNHCYSPKTLVDVQGCPKCKALLNTPHYFAIRFTNNDRNVQLKLPLEIQIGHNDTLMFLWIFLACIGMYLGVGTLHGTVVKKKKGVEALPHTLFWGEVAGLCRDGVAFSLTRAGLADKMPSIFKSTGAAAAAKDSKKSSSKSDRRESLMSNSSHSRQHRPSEANSTRSAASARSGRSTRSTKSKSGKADGKSKSSKKDKKDKRKESIPELPEVGSEATAVMTAEQRMMSLSEVRDEAVHPSQAPIKIVVD